VIRLSRVVAIEAKKKQMKKPSRTKSKAGEKQGPAPGNVIRIMSARRKPVEVENRSGRRQT
jgi:DNA end-binding protein Ku